MKRNILKTLLVDIVVPIAVYLALTGSGWTPVWALVASAAASVLVLGISWLRTRTVSTLGVLVLVRFVLGIVVALFTGDARFVLVKDYLITFLLAVGAAATLKLDRPFIARIRRDLTPRTDQFDHQWRTNPPFRAVHRQLTRWWVTALISEVTVAVIIVYTTPLTVAVIATNILSPAVLLTLIALTQARARHTENDTAAVPAGERPQRW